jgi:hypothetical protein
MELTLKFNFPLSLDDTRMIAKASQKGMIKYSILPENLTLINVPLSLEDFLSLQKNMREGTIKWKDFPDNLRSGYTNFKSEYDKPMMEELTKKGLSTPFN